MKSNAEMRDMNAELDNCTFVRTVLMILVVIYHSALFWGGGWFTGDPIYSSDILKYFAKWLNSFHIYGFTLVSGYVFYRMKYERNKYREFLPFLEGKAKRLLVPYVFVSLVWVIPFDIIFNRATFVDIVKDYVFAAAPSQLWFLVMLFGVFVISWLLSDLFVGNGFAGACIAVGAFFFSKVLARFVPNAFQIIRIFSCLIYFYIGMKLSQGKAGFLRKIPVLVYLLINVGTLVVSETVTFPACIAGKVISATVKLIVTLSGSLMAFFGLQWIADRVKWRESAVFGFLSQRSMPVYLFHQQVIYVSIFVLNGVVVPIVNALANFAFSMAVSLLISSLLLKWRPTAFLIGEKWEKADKRAAGEKEEKEEK